MNPSTPSAKLKYQEKGISMKPTAFGSLGMQTLFMVSCLCLAATAGQAQELIFESATVGPTNQYGSGTIIGPTQYLGVRFHLSEDTHITGVGGHVWAENFTWAGVFDAFLVRMHSHGALPEGHPFTEEELVASIVCEPTVLESRDYIFPIDVELPAGHYALVFGGGMFGNARLAGNDEPVHNPSYIVWDLDGWRDYVRAGRNGRRVIPDYRFTLYGEPLR